MSEWDLDNGTNIYSWDKDWGNLFQGTSGSFNPNNRYGFSEDYATKLRDSTLYSNPLSDQAKMLSGQQGFPGATTYSTTDGGLAGLFGDSTGIGNKSEGYFDKLLKGDTGALGLAGLGMKGAGLAAQLAMLPGAMETAKLQNEGLKLAVEEAKKDSANKAAIRQQLSSISV